MVEGKDGMNVKIETDPALEETEVIIRCGRLDDAVVNLQKTIIGQGAGEDVSQCLSLQLEETSYYIPMSDLLFFETEGSRVYAHTAVRLFEAPYRLYELEELLPSGFMRISKSTIVNLDHIYSVTRNLTASSLVEFAGSDKKALVSRGYYKALMERLKLRRLRCR